MSPVRTRVWDGAAWQGAADAPSTPAATPYDWSDTNLPWAYTSTSDFTTAWPSSVTVVPIQTASTDFYTNLAATVAAAGGRVVVELGEGVYELSEFRLIGSSGDPKYAFGFWFPNLQGLLGQGPDKTYVQMAANSVSPTQLASIATMTKAAFASLQMGLCRFDGADAASPILLAGLTFRSEDQNPFTSTASDMQDLFYPQPCPHRGVFLYTGSHSRVSYVRFQGAGRALNSQPPFEMSNVSTARGWHYFDHCEVDGRRSPDLDPARPRRCTIALHNNESVVEWSDSWFHHSNVSRYATNDQNYDTSGTYKVTRCKSEHITDDQNRDPALNGGATLGGYTNASLFGWESCNGTIEVRDSIAHQDNTLYAGQVPCHLQLTYVGSRNPQGGRLYVHGGDFRNSGFPAIDGFVTFRIAQNTYWYLDGYNTTLYVYHPDGQRLSPHQYTGTWPPTESYLAAQGISPATHYIVRSA